MSLKKAISVIMSTYNDSDKLSATIDSVLSQTFTEFEFIIVNDGSPDPGTCPVLENYAVRDERIKIIKKNNQGITRALIDGCNLARGDYIARIDVGDVMLPHRLQLQKEILDQYPDVGFVSCWTEFCAPEWEHLWISRGAPETREPVNLLPESSQEGLAGDIPHHGSVMFRKSFYDQAGGYRWQFYYGQDWDLWYRMAVLGRYFIVPEILYRVRIMADGISMTSANRQRKVARCSMAAFVACRDGLPELPFLEKASRIRPNVKNKREKMKNLEPGFYFIGERLRRNGDRQARKYFYKAIGNDIFSLRSYVRLAQTFI